MNLFEDNLDESKFKTISIEELNNGFLGNTNSLENVMSNKSFEEISPFKNSPFGQYWEKNLPTWAIEAYGPARVYNQSNFSLVDASKKIGAASAAFYNTLIDENWDDIKLTQLNLH